MLSFKCKETEKIWNQERSLRFPVSIQRIALRKLFMLHRAKELRDLRILPATRLERLKGDRIGQYSIRINDQWKICFIWNNANASAVEILRKNSSRNSIFLHTDLRKKLKCRRQEYLK